MIGSARRRRTAATGFALSEAIVALVVVTLGIAAFCQAADTSYRATARVRQQTMALAAARSLLDDAVQDDQLAEGDSSGRFGQSLSWRMTVQPLASQATGLTGVFAGNRPRAAWIIVETLDRRGAVLARLETAKLVRETP